MHTNNNALESELTIPPEFNENLLGIENSDSFELDPEVALEALAHSAGMNQLSFRTNDDEGEMIIHFQKIEFHNNSIAVLQLPFSPPLINLPKIEASFIDGTDARLRITGVQRHGARIEIILSKIPSVPVRSILSLTIFAEANQNSS